MDVADFSLDEIEAIVSDGPRTTPYPRVEQRGPLRHCDTEMRCKSPRCGSPTYYKVLGIPQCMVHALRRLNDLLIERGM